VYREKFFKKIKEKEKEKGKSKNSVSRILTRTQLLHRKRESSNRIDLSLSPKSKSK
jgi:hypothetical protein